MSIFQRRAPFFAYDSPKGERAGHRRGGFRIILIAVVMFLVSSCSDSLGPDEPRLPELAVVLVEVEPADLSLGEGRAVKLTAVARDSAGDPLLPDAISWKSTDTTLATVDPEGIVRGLRRGQAKILARAGAKEGEAAIEVRAPLSTVSMATPPGPVHIGERVRLEITLVTAEGDTVSSSRVRVAWSSSDTAVARVEEDGWVTGIAPGTARITATSEGTNGHEDVHVSGEAGQKWQVTVRPTSSVLDAVGESVQLTAELTDSTGKEVQDANFAWTSLDTKVATVTDAGKVLSHAVGTALIVAAAHGAADTASVEVREEPAPPPIPAGFLPAFPGAEGWGATALEGCRDLPLVVHEVTNTNDSGAGSLRDVLENRVRPNRYDIVIFRTGGLIRLQRGILEHRLNCLYIAGQTAPGGGISIVGSQIEFRRSDDLVVRHLRHRGQSGTGFRIRGGERVILDHISASWAGAANYGGAYIMHFTGTSTLAINYQLNAATIQNSLIYEPDRRHPTALGLSGGPKDEPDARRISAHRNVLMGPGHRLPMCSALEIDIINNIIYNWSSRSTESNNTASCDWIANYHRPGPATGGGFSGMPFVPGDGCEVSGSSCSYSFYVAENRNPRNDYISSGANPWEGSARQVGCRKFRDGIWCPANGAVAPPTVRRQAPHPPSTIPVDKRPITDAFVDEIVEIAGHSKRLACDGSWIPVRDEADGRRAAWFRSGTGPSSTVSVDTMRIEVPARGAACSDLDGDGIPDDYEIRHSGSATGLRPDRVTASGYLLIELYLAGKQPSWTP